MNSLTSLLVTVFLAVGGTEGFSFGRYDGSSNVEPASQGFNNFDPFNMQQGPQVPYQVPGSLMPEEYSRPLSYPRYPHYQAHQAQIFSYPHRNRYSMNLPQYEGLDEMYNPFHSPGSHINRIIVRPGGHRGYNPYGRHDYYGGSTFRSDSGVSAE